MSEGSVSVVPRFTTFPLHRFTRNEDGKLTCGCNKEGCKNYGKCPAWKYSELEPGQRVPSRPDAGTALLTGWKSGIFVVDTDGPDADARFRAIGELPETYTVATPSGGRHYYFAWPGFAVRTSGGEFNRMPGEKSSHIDIRGDVNGYVVLPGSPHKSGREYVVENAGPIAYAPDWLLAWDGLRGQLEREGDVTGYRPFPVQPQERRMLPDGTLVSLLEERRQMGKAACETYDAAISGQGGQGALWALALYLVRTLELPLETCVDLITSFYNPRCEPPWSEREIAHKLEGARDKSDMMCGVVTPIDTSKFVATKKKREPTMSDEDPTLANLQRRASEEGIGVESARLARCSDTGNAEIFVRLHRDRVRFVHAWDSWLVWDGARWKRDDMNEVMRLTKCVVDHRWSEIQGMGDPDAEETKTKRIRWALATESKKGRDNMLALAQSEDPIALSHERLDSDPWILNVLNGTIDLRTGELRGHNRNDALTKLANVSFDPDATCPTWQEFLARVTGGSAELVSFLQRAVGYSLTGQVGEQVLMFLYGGGANGKSTFTRIVRELLGEYAKQAAPNLLLAKHGESHPTEIADLHGARFVICQEVEQGRAWAEATLKQLTGSDFISARHMKEDFWEFAPTHKLWVCANHKPRVRGTDEAIWRRFKIVPFTVTIPKEERDPDLLEKLRAELPGILTWAVLGCLEWQRAGLGSPDTIQAATDEYRREEDRVKAFLEEVCETGPGPKFEVSKGLLFSTYAEWAKSENEPSLSKREFGDRLKAAGFEGTRTGPKGHIWRGLRLRPATSCFGATAAQ